MRNDHITDGTPPIYPDQKPQREPLSYVALFAVVLVAVTVGNLLSNWLTAQYAAYATARALQTFSNQTNQIMRDTAAQTKAALEQARREQQAREQQAAEQATQTRIASPIGRKLEQQCEDWTRAYNQFKSDAALQERARHCGRYQGYIQTGQYSP